MEQVGYCIEILHNNEHHPLSACHKNPERIQKQILFASILSSKTTIPKTHFQHAGNHDEQLLHLQAHQSAAKTRSKDTQIIRILAILTVKRKWQRFLDGSDDAPNNGTMLHLFDLLIRVFHAFRIIVATTSGTRRRRRMGSIH